MFEKAITWYSNTTSRSEKSVSETRDVFEGRTQRLFKEAVRAGFSQDEASLLYAVVGELGNNAYDHNLGHWLDQPGCFFEYIIKPKTIFIIIADRGRGIQSSLQRVLPDLKSEQEAIEVAFEKRISGRAPERRGNGLKFVREVLNGNSNRFLFAKSGAGIISFGGSIDIQKKLTTIAKKAKNKGTVILLGWSF